MVEPAKHRYQVLDSLRGICACLVVLYHFHTIGVISNLPFLRNSWLFVDFFFVLSGFVITTAYRARIANGFSPAHFMWLRLGRIYPVHLFVTLLFVLVQIGLWMKIGNRAFQGNKSLETLIASLTLTQTFTLPNGWVWNIPSWSIAVEMWTYLLFAVFFRAFRSRTSLALVSGLLAAFSCAYIARFYDGNMDVYHYGAFFRCTYGFALGVIGAEFYPIIRGRLAAVGSMLELTTLALVAFVVSVVGRGPFSMSAPPLFLVVVIAYSGETGSISRWLKTSFPRKIGELSYSIYMIHFFIIYRVSGIIQFINNKSGKDQLLCETTYSCSATGSRLLADALIVPVLIAVVTAAWLLRHFVEVPCERWAKRVLSRRTQVAGGGAGDIAATVPGPPS